jgi:hypothetical protein
MLVAYENNAERHVGRRLVSTINSALRVSQARKLVKSRRTSQNEKRAGRRYLQLCTQFTEIITVAASYPAIQARNPEIVVLGPTFATAYNFLMPILRAIGPVYRKSSVYYELAAKNRKTHVMYLLAKANCALSTTRPTAVGTVFKPFPYRMILDTEICPFRLWRCRATSIEFRSPQSGTCQR